MRGIILAVFLCGGVMPGAPRARAAAWTLDPPRIRRVVKVKTLAEARAAVQQPGTEVVLEADLDGQGQDGLILAVNDIRIEGNGKTLSNARRGVASGNDVLWRIEVKNLTLKNCGVGISLRRDRHVHVHHNTLLGCRSRGMHFENSFGNHGRFFEVHDNVVRGGRKGAITFQDGCTDGRVYNNVCEDGGYGPQSYANGCLNLDSNMIRVEVYGNRIRGGTYGLAVRGQNNSGMHDCRIHDNIIEGAKKAGLRIAYFTFRNLFRGNTVKNCPVGVYYQKAYRVKANLLDGVSIENCPLPVQVDGAPAALKSGRIPSPTSQNVERLVLKNWKGGGPVLKVSGGRVPEHTVADAGPWKAGAVLVNGAGNKVVWASFAYVTVRDGEEALAGAEVTSGKLRATTGADGRACIGPFPALEITPGGVRRVARETRLTVRFKNKQAEASFTPDGAPVRLSLQVSKSRGR